MLDVVKRNYTPVKSVLLCIIMTGAAAARKQIPKYEAYWPQNCKNCVLNQVQNQEMLNLNLVESCFRLLFFINFYLLLLPVNQADSNTVQCSRDDPFAHTESLMLWTILQTFSK